MQYQIIRASEADWEDAMALAYRVFLKYESEEYGPEGTCNFFAFVSDQGLKRMFLAGEYPLFVAKDGDRIVGLISARCGNHISLLFVDEAYHRMGIGAALIETLTAYLKRNTLYRAVTVNASPYGEPFYHKVGFLDTASRTKKDGIIYTPMIYHFY